MGLATLEFQYNQISIQILNDDDKKDLFNFSLVTQYCNYLYDLLQYQAHKTPAAAAARPWNKVRREAAAAEVGRSNGRGEAEQTWSG